MEFKSCAFSHHYLIIEFSSNSNWEYKPLFRKLFLGKKEGSLTVTLVNNDTLRSFPNSLGDSPGSWRWAGSEVWWTLSPPNPPPWHFSKVPGDILMTEFNLLFLKLTSLNLSAAFGHQGLFLPTWQQFFFSWIFMKTHFFHFLLVSVVTIAEFSS